MKRECQDIWESVVALAEGQANDRATAHLEGCEDCRRRFEQLQSMFAGLGLASFEVPPTLVQAAKSLMFGQAKRLGLIRTSFQLSAARAPSQDFQAVYGGEGIEVRVMYSKVDQGWEVMGRTPAGEWRVEAEGSPVDSDEHGRFHFVVGSLDKSAFSLIGEHEACEIPSANEAIDGLRNDS